MIRYLFWTKSRSRLLSRGNELYQVVPVFLPEKSGFFLFLALVASEACSCDEHAGRGVELGID